MITTAEETTELLAQPWTITPERYQHLMGVKQPWIAEISPWQYSNMGKRQKAAYDKKREEEWGASIDVKREWRDKVIAAYTEGKITKNDPSLDKEARDAIRHFEHYQEKQRQEEVKKQAHRSNQITSLDEVKVGDRVFEIMTGRYGTITKKNRLSVGFQPENHPGGYQITRPMKVSPACLLWKKYDDVKI
jgi:hypothetical protein